MHDFGDAEFLLEAILDELFGGQVPEVVPGVGMEVGPFPGLAAVRTGRAGDPTVGEGRLLGVACRPWFQSAASSLGRTISRQVSASFMARPSVPDNG